LEVFPAEADLPVLLSEEVPVKVLLWYELKAVVEAAVEWVVLTSKI
jgi:hypothetical protein